MDPPVGGLKIQNISSTNVFTLELSLNSVAQYIPPVPSQKLISLKEQSERKQARAKQNFKRTVSVSKITKLVLNFSSIGSFYSMLYGCI